MLAILGMCPCDRLTVAGIATDGMVISVAVIMTADITIISPCCTFVRAWFLSLVYTGIAPVRGSVSAGTTLIAFIAARHLALLWLFVGTF